MPSVPRDPFPLKYKALAHVMDIVNDSWSDLTGENLITEREDFCASTLLGAIMILLGYETMALFDGNADERAKVFEKLKRRVAVEENIKGDEFRWYNMRRTCELPEQRRHTHFRLLDDWHLNYSCLEKHPEPHNEQKCLAEMRHSSSCKLCRAIRDANLAMIEERHQRTGHKAQAEIVFRANMSFLGIKEDKTQGDIGDRCILLLCCLCHIVTDTKEQNSKDRTLQDITEQDNNTAHLCRYVSKPVDQSQENMPPPVQVAATRPALATQNNNNRRPMQRLDLFR